MNKKIIILLSAVAVIAIIGIIMRRTSLGNTGEISSATNQFTAKIEQEIKQLSQKPDNKFCKDYYKEIAYHINDFYKQNRFGNNQSENNQEKENLENKLYAAYADKFTKQAFVVFKGSDWNSEDINFIQAEKNELKRSKMLDAGSPVDNKFAEIQMVLDKYSEIAGFISSCKNFSYSSISLSDGFPISEVNNKLSQAKNYLNKNLENSYVNQCTRLHDDLKEIPQFLFRAHVKYLDNKIDSWSNEYSKYNSQADYSDNLYKPLKEEIDALDNDIYKAANFDSEYKRLSNKLSADNQKAYYYSYPK
jgi:hypothetical protein